MGNLLNTYEKMQAEQLQKAAEDKVMTERVEVLSKYAEAAQALLQDKYPNNYTQADVEKLAVGMIQHDLEAEEQQEKIAELDEAGRIMARAFLDEVNNSKK